MSGPATVRSSRGPAVTLSVGDPLSHDPLAKHNAKSSPPPPRRHNSQHRPSAVARTPRDSPKKSAYRPRSSPRVVPSEYQEPQGNDSPKSLKREAPYYEKALRTFALITAREDTRRQTQSAADEQRKMTEQLLRDSHIRRQLGGAFIPSLLNAATSNYERIHNALFNTSEFTATMAAANPFLSEEYSKERIMDRELRKDIRDFMATTGDLNIVIRIDHESLYRLSPRLKSLSPLRLGPAVAATSPVTSPTSIPAGSPLSPVHLDESQAGQTQISSPVLLGQHPPDFFSGSRCVPHTGTRTATRAGCRLQGVVRVAPRFGNDLRVDGDGEDIDGTGGKTVRTSRNVIPPLDSKVQPPSCTSSLDDSDDDSTDDEHSVNLPAGFMSTGTQCEPMDPYPLLPFLVPQLVEFESLREKVEDDGDENDAIVDVDLTASVLKDLNRVLSGASARLSEYSRVDVSTPQSKTSTTRTSTPMSTKASSSSVFQKTPTTATTVVSAFRHKERLKRAIARTLDEVCVGPNDSDDEDNESDEDEMEAGRTKRKKKKKKDQTVAKIGLEHMLLMQMHIRHIEYNMRTVRHHMDTMVGDRVPFTTRVVSAAEAYASVECMPTDPYKYRIGEWTWRDLQKSLAFYVYIILCYPVCVNFYRDLLSAWDWQTLQHVLLTMRKVECASDTPVAIPQVMAKRLKYRPQRGFRSERYEEMAMTAQDDLRNTIAALERAQRMYPTDPDKLASYLASSMIKKPSKKDKAPEIDASNAKFSRWAHLRSHLFIAMVACLMKEGKTDPLVLKGMLRNAHHQQQRLLEKIQARANAQIIRIERAARQREQKLLKEQQKREAQMRAMERTQQAKVTTMQTAQQLAEQAEFLTSSIQTMDQELFQEREQFMTFDDRVENNEKRIPQLRARLADLLSQIQDETTRERLKEQIIEMPDELKEEKNRWKREKKKTEAEDKKEQQRRNRKKSAKPAGGLSAHSASIRFGTSVKSMSDVEEVESRSGAEDNDEEIEEEEGLDGESKSLSFSTSSRKGKKGGRKSIRRKSQASSVGRSSSLRSKQSFSSLASTSKSRRRTKKKGEGEGDDDEGDEIEEEIDQEDDNEDRLSELGQGGATGKHKSGKKSGFGSMRSMRKAQSIRGAAGATSGNRLVDALASSGGGKAGSVRQKAGSRHGGSGKGKGGSKRGGDGENEGLDEVGSEGSGSSGFSLVMGSRVSIGGWDQAIEIASSFVAGEGNRDFPDYDITDTKPFGSVHGSEKGVKFDPDSVDPRRDGIAGSPSQSFRKSPTVSNRANFAMGHWSPPTYRDAKRPGLDVRGHGLEEYSSAASLIMSPGALLKGKTHSPIPSPPRSPMSKDSELRSTPDSKTPDFRPPSGDVSQDDVYDEEDDQPSGLQPLVAVPVVVAPAAFSFDTLKDMINPMRFHGGGTLLPAMRNEKFEHLLRSVAKRKKEMPALPPLQETKVGSEEFNLQNELRATKVKLGRLEEQLKGLHQRDPIRRHLADTKREYRIRIAQIQHELKEIAEEQQQLQLQQTSSGSESPPSSPLRAARRAASSPKNRPTAISLELPPHEQTGFEISAFRPSGLPRPQFPPKRRKTVPLPAIKEGRQKAR